MLGVGSVESFSAWRRLSIEFWSLAWAEQRVLELGVGSIESFGAWCGLSREFWNLAWAQ